MHNNNFCDFCGRTYFSEGSLRYHRRNTHLSTTKRPFKCPHCPLSFVRPAFLKCHLKTHPRGQVGGDQVQCVVAPNGSLIVHPGVIVKRPPATSKLINPAQNTAEGQDARNHSYKGDNMQWVEENQAENVDDEVFLSPPHLSLPPPPTDKKSLAEEDFPGPPLLTPQDSPRSIFNNDNDHDDTENRQEKEESDSEEEEQPPPPPEKEYYEPLIVTRTTSLTPRKNGTKGKVVKTKQKLNFTPHGIWFQCQICKVLVETKRTFITHKRSHIKRSATSVESKKEKRPKIGDSPQAVPKAVPIQVDNIPNGQRDVGFPYVPGFPTNRITTIKQEPM